MLVHSASLPLLINVPLPINKTTIQHTISNTNHHEIMDMGCMQLVHGCFKNIALHLYCDHYSVLDSKNDFEPNSRICSCYRVIEQFKHDHIMMTSDCHTMSIHPSEEFCISVVQWASFNYDIWMQEHSLDPGFHNEIGFLKQSYAAQLKT